MTLPSAGWYPDPENWARSRWWNGIAWTDNYSDNQAPVAPTHPAGPAGSMAPVAPYSYSTSTAALSAPAGTPWSTVWIWLIVFLPYVSMLGLVLVDWRGLFNFTYMSSESAMRASMFSPGYFIAIILGWVAFGLSVWFAYRDWRELGRRGVPRPFHWAFAFLSSAVYPIGRSVVVKRRTGQGISPMWVSIALIVMSFIFSIYLSVYIVTV
ncbi:MAG: DUF2510 domain-containing protein, partial [Microbacteriaceae bacterium]|nr:DUF2510 domain-containing protein [Microbacteriaceae bacterium]